MSVTVLWMSASWSPHLRSVDGCAFSCFLQEVAQGIKQVRFRSFCTIDTKCSYLKHKKQMHSTWQIECFPRSDVCVELNSQGYSGCTRTYTTHSNTYVSTLLIHTHSHAHNNSQDLLSSPAKCWAPTEASQDYSQNNIRCNFTVPYVFFW